MNVWGVLRIAPTDDIAAIRSAYAKALKTIDMDTDPLAYIALRDARDEAIADVRQRAWDAAQEPAEYQPLVTDDAPPEGHVEVPVGDFNSHFASIMRLLEAEPGAPLGDAEAAIVRAEFAAALKDPQMDELSFRAQAELQLAHLVASSLPRAETLAAPMIAAFGWDAPARVDTPPAIAAILDHVSAAAEQRTIPIDTDRLPSFHAPEQKIEAGTGGEVLTTTTNAEYYGEHYNAIAKLLFPQVGEDEVAPPLAPDEQQKLREHFATLISDPRMELVGFSAGAEREIAQLIAYSLPRSDPIVPAAIEFFAWEDTEGRIDQTGMVAHVLNRARGLRFIAAVQSPSHDFHAAWRDLQTPVTTRKWWEFLTPQVAANNVASLLTAIRTEQPLLENELDAEKVEAWVQRLNGNTPHTVGNPVVITLVVVVIGFFVLMAATGVIKPQYDRSGNYSGMAMGNDAQPAYPPENDQFADGRRHYTAVGDEIEASDADAIDPILERIGGDALTYRQLAFTNPAMHKLIEDKLRGARAANQSRGDFAFAMGEILRERIRAGLHSSTDYVAVVDYQRFVLAALKERATPVQCVALARSPGSLIDEPSPSIERQNVFARVLSKVPADAPSAGSIDALRGYDIKTLKKIGDRIGQPDALKVSAILAGQSGDDGLQCLAHIVALEVLLEMPPAEAQRQLTL